MKFSKIIVVVFTLMFFSSCVLIHESRNKKRLENVEYETVYKDEEEKEFVSEEEISNRKETEIKDNNKVAAKIEVNPNEIWYHPNPWWRIESKPFSTSKDSLKIRRYAPQYGFSNYIDPITKSTSDEWSTWMNANNLNSYGNSVHHVWQSFISKYKAEMEAHPEYLAEVDGKRPGYGKTSKLCVSNKNVQNLFTEYIKSNIAANPTYSIYSIEPSDGTGFCTCSNCQKFGNVNDQIFQFANIIAREVKKTYPNKQLGLYAYYQHSDIPPFKLEDNIQVIVVPNGFQTVFSPFGMLRAWQKHHSNIGIYEYFGIAQSTGDQPRVTINNFLSNLNFIQKNNGKMLIYEAGANINAILAATMLSKIMMNPDLKWSEVYSKFLDDCFKDSQVPIKRLFDRWHTYGQLNENEINYSLYDLNEANQLAKNPLEVQRIRDLKAYIHFLIVYAEWNKDRTNKNSLIKYFDYLYNSSNRNIVNYGALVTLFAKHYKDDSALNIKYSLPKSKKSWVKYITDKEIDNNFEDDLKKYPPIKINYVSINDFESTLKKSTDYNNINTFEINLLNTKNVFIYSNSLSLKVTPQYKMTDSKALITVSDYLGNYVEQKLIDDGEAYSLSLPQKGLYIVTMNRVSSAKLKLDGQFLVLSGTTSKNQESKYTFYTINQNRQLQKINRTDKLTGTAPYYIIGNINIDK